MVEGLCQHLKDPAPTQVGIGFACVFSAVLFFLFLSSNFHSTHILLTHTIYSQMNLCKLDIRPHALHIQQAHTTYADWCSMLPCQC